MLNAMIHMIIEEGLYDRQYVEAYTEGFEGLREHLKAFPPEAMAPICGIDAETLRTVARIYATARSARSSSGAWGSRSTSTAPTTPAA